MCARACVRARVYECVLYVCMCVCARACVRAYLCVCVCFLDGVRSRVFASKALVANSIYKWQCI